MFRPVSRKPMNPATMWSQYLAARSAGALLTCFDIENNLRLARGGGRAMYRLDRKHRERAGRSIQRAFPHWTQEERDRCVRRSFEHFLQLAVETIHADRLMPHGGWVDRIKFCDVGPSLAYLNQQRPMILITGHLGNWEVVGYYLSMMGFRVHALARPLDNQLLNDWALNVRQRRGLRIITKWEATDQMLNVIRKGEPLCFVADQNAGNRGMFVPFFGRLASSYKSIGLLAMRYELPIVVGFAHRAEDGFNYEVGVTEVIEPEDWQDRQDALFYITARFNRGLEMTIRRRPEQYLWMHRRWKSRPKHELEDKPMPDRMRSKLEALPWMTDELMAEVATPISREEAR